MPTHTASAFNRLIERLTRLPGVGKRSAERMAFHLLRAPGEEAGELAEAIRVFRSELTVCGRCGSVSEMDPCPICRDADRDQGLVLVVEQPADVAGFEQTGLYQGVYHVLMGRLDPLEGVGPGELNLEPLMHRVRQGEVREVILGTQPTLEGDGTCLYLADELRKHGVKVTRLARGVPTGASLTSVSKAVLADAIEGRGENF